MAVLKKVNSILKKLKRDESGIAAISWALSLTAIIGAAGAAMDFALLSNADARAQSIADTTSLAAAIYVKTHGRAPTAQGELTEGLHYASDLGYDFKSFVHDGVEVHIDYDDNSKEVTTTVSGETTPILIQILGYDKLSFNSKSVVSYLNIDEKFPASIALVLDNSGSMAWDDRFALNSGASPANGRPRITGLEEAVNTFMTDLNNRLGDQVDSTHRVLRTGMLPYNDQIIPASSNPNDRGGLVNMQWGRISNGQITAMRASGATNSSPPMQLAWDWLKDEVGTESDHHREAIRNEVPAEDPLRFVIFMTDGQNTAGNIDFIADDTTNRWYAFKSLFGRSARWWVSSGGPFDSDFEQGRLQLASDRETLEVCNEMNLPQNNVKVFSIGYALQPGVYNANNPNNPTDTEEVTVGMQATAHGLLAGCATDSSTMFIEADDIDQLKAAFDEIQNAIVEELIRVKS